MGLKGITECTLLTFFKAGVIEINVVRVVGENNVFLLHPALINLLRTSFNLVFTHLTDSDRM